ncbi:MAG: beta-hexosaminidase, partial [Firmicutes bacterium]|nr:beta-hexosaminidase [Bacillota bacterium]
SVTVAEGAAAAALDVCVLGPPRDLTRARQIMDGMSLGEQVGQMFLARCPEYDGAEEAARLHLGGYVLFDRDLAYYGFDEAKARIASYQQAADLPMFMAVDEEGGEVVRISCYPAYRYERFASPQEVYSNGGLEGLAADAREKAALLLSLGVNVDLAPVADVSTSPYDFIYSRSLGEDAATTAHAVAAMVKGLEQVGVSACLKHFPGYGDNGDTHSGVETDYREAEVFYEQDLLPFRAGCDAGADFVLVSHNIVVAFDAELPSSLSPAVHSLLRDELGFSGLIITDDLAMEGVAGLYGVDETAVLAVLAGNDMLLSSDPEEQIDAVLNAVETGRVPEELIDGAVQRILRTKIRAGLIPLTEPAAAEDAAA